MNSRIHLLPQLVANQIAAGEVIERPASVVKELLENSLDAGATRLDIHIEQGGMRLIRVRDNGNGIDKDDLGLALSRHATSKIATTDDLNAINSLGFRGEALASICSVAQVTLQSYQAPAKHAWQIHASGAEINPTINQVAHTQGTTISVADLFFNTPVRRKFLRSERTELLHIEHMVRCIALSRFDIAIHFFHNQKPLYRWPAALESSQYSQRLAKIVGQPFVNQARFINAHTPELRLSGWVGTAEFSRSQTDVQYFFVNGRIVRDKLIQHAIRQAYDPIISPGRHPGFVLYLELDPAALDVNVHPTKHEIRFHQSRMVHDFVLSQLQQALQNHAPSPLPPSASLTATSPTRGEVKERLMASAISQPATVRALCVLYDDYLLAKAQDEIVLLNRKNITQLFLQHYFDTTAVPIPSRPLLWPVADACSKINPTHLARLNELGFEATLLTPTEIALRAVPAILGEIAPLAILHAIIAVCCSSTPDVLPALIAQLPLPVFHALTEWQKWLDDIWPFIEKDNVTKKECLRLLSEERLHQLFTS